MAKSGETKFLGEEQQRFRVSHALDVRAPNRPAAPRLKKERRASKGRVKGRMRN